MTKSLKTLNAKGICTGCHKQQTKDIYDTHGFNARAFAREPLQLYKPVIDLKKYRISEESSRRLLAKKVWPKRKDSSDLTPTVDKHHELFK